MTKKEQKYRDSFIFYRSFYESIKELEQKQQQEITLAIMSYQFEGKEIDLKGISKAIFTLIKPQLKANNKRYDNGCKGGRPKTKTKPKNNQNKTKTKPNKNVNVNVNVNENEKEEISFLSDDVLSNWKDIWFEWLQYKISMKNKYKTERGEKSAFTELLNLSDKNKDKANKIIKQSINKEWKGFFELKQEKKKTTHPIF